MRFSVWPSPQQPWESVLDAARRAEATGWDGIWIADHFMPNGDDVSAPVLECWSVLAALAAEVPRLRLGSLVAGNTYRHPAVLANQAAAVDRISGGRLVLGIGAGWQQNEHDAYGIPFLTVRERLERLGEACQVIRALTTEERATFSGSHYELRDAPLEPKPVQQPLPLLVGGGGEKVTMRIAAEHADEWNCWGTPETLRHKVGVLERHCDSLGRDPTTIARSAQALLFLSDDRAFLDDIRSRGLGMPHLVGDPEEISEQVQAYVDAGVDELIIPDFNLGSRRSEVYEQLITEVAPAFR